MNIGFFEINLEEEINFFKQNLSNHNLSFFKEPLNYENLNNAKDLDIVSTFVNCRLDEKTISELPMLKGIFARSTGTDVIDIKFANKKGIKVYNVPTYGSHTVAEFTFALILGLLRNLPQAINRTKTERKFQFDNLRGFDLYNKTLGIIGTGKIGQNVAKMAHGFGMNIIAYDLFPNADFASQFNVKYTSLEDLLGNAQIISLHAPATAQNHHLINKNNIGLMKKGAYVINTARGSLIDTDALYNALRDGQLGGAALDVLEEEQDLKEEADLFKKGASIEKYKNVLENHLLIDLPNVIVTPHVAFYTYEAQHTILETVVQNINAFGLGSNTNLVE